ncbi:MAG: hypothetical protein KKI08_12985, partial [Armatimonadetes bacterium]|nr:hypothetical protein [Armatimonadota bacterium]
VYCVSPAPLAAPQLALKAATAKAGDTVAYTVSLKGGADTRRQVVHLTVLAPDGTEYRDYDRNMLLGSKAVAGSFRLALNDPPGKWRIMARDVASGQATEATFTVE